MVADTRVIGTYRVVLTRQSIIRYTVESRAEIKTTITPKPRENHAMTRSHVDIYNKLEELTNSKMNSITPTTTNVKDEVHCYV
jgi:hypothetical protein